MAHVNLLPWRAELRQQRQREYISILSFFALLAVIVVGLVHFHNEEKIRYQNARNTYLDGQVQLLDKKIKEIEELEKQKEKLLARMRAIEELQGNRPLIVRLFDEIVTSIPDGVSLNNLKQTAQKITINGMAQSNARVSSFMRNLDRSEWLTNPQLDIIQSTQEESRIRNFTLRFDQVLPNFSESEDEEAL